MRDCLAEQRAKNSLIDQLARSRALNYQAKSPAMWVSEQIPGSELGSIKRQKTAN